MGKASRKKKEKAQAGTANKAAVEPSVAQVAMLAILDDDTEALDLIARTLKISVARCAFIPIEDADGTLPLYLGAMRDGSPNLLAAILMDADGSGDEEIIDALISAFVQITIASQGSSDNAEHIEMLVNLIFESCALNSPSLELDQAIRASDLKDQWQAALDQAALDR